MSESYILNHLITVNSDDIQHHGILGMRWGIRRYQPYPKGYFGTGKEIGEAAKKKPKNAFEISQKELQKVIDSRKTKDKSRQYLTKKEVKNIENQRKVVSENMKKAREASKKKREHDKDKDRVLREGSASEILEYIGEISNKELQDSLNRVKWTNELKDIANKDIKSAFDKMDKAMKDLSKINNWGSTAIDTWNMLASIYNSKEKDPSKHWTHINKSQGGKNK